MQRMICISAEQYSRMMESYDEAMKELKDLRQQLQAIRYSNPGAGVALVQEDEEK